MTDALIYAYGVVPAETPRPPDSLVGVDGAPVRLISAGRLLGIASDVDRAVYEEESLNARLADVQWVGERGVAHERVLTWFVDRVPVVPFTLFSLHQSEMLLRKRLEERSDRLGAALERVRGRREWGIRLWRDESRFAEHLEHDSSALRELASEMESASEGRRFLLEKKRDTIRAEEARRVSSDLTTAVFASLREAAEDAKSLAIPPAANATRTLVLHAAFLVPDSEYARFQDRVRELAAVHTPAGFDWEFTGPWPPYHFTTI